MGLLDFIFGRKHKKVAEPERQRPAYKRPKFTYEEYGFKSQGAYDAAVKRAKNSVEWEGIPFEKALAREAPTATEINKAREIAEHAAKARLRKEEQLARKRIPIRKPKRTNIRRK